MSVMGAAVVPQVSTTLMQKAVQSGLWAAMAAAARDAATRVFWADMFLRKTGQAK